MTVMLCEDLEIMFVKVPDWLLTQISETAVYDVCGVIAVLVCSQPLRCRPDFTAQGSSCPPVDLLAPIFKFLMIYIYLGL